MSDLLPDRPDIIAHGTGARHERTFPFKHLLLRLVWNMAWALLASWTPPQLHGWRRWLLKLFGASIDRTAKVYGSARIWYPPNLVMGPRSMLGWRSYAYSQGQIVIEEGATVSQWVRLVTGTHEIETDNFRLFTRPIIIRRHAWIAAGAFVGPGVEVGEGAVLGGAAVAFKNLEPWTVYVGNPAKAIKTRARLPGVSGEAHL